MRLAHSVALCALLAAPLAAKADTISVYSTGLGGAGVSDPHYTIVASSALTTPISAYGVPNAPAVGSQPGYYQPTVGLYINPTGNGTTVAPTGATYDYETTFSLAANENVSTAMLNLGVAADDTVTVYLNGFQVFTGGTYASLTTTSITSHFVTGVNTLDFDITNTGGGPTGLYAQVSGTVSPAGTPEPSSMILLGTGLLSIAAAGRRKFFNA